MLALVSCRYIAPAVTTNFLIRSRMSGYIDRTDVVHVSRKGTHPSRNNREERCLLRTRSNNVEQVEPSRDGVNKRPNLEKEGLEGGQARKVSPTFCHRQLCRG